MNSFTITIKGINGDDENVTAYACYPISGELTLDRSLDQAYIDLKASPRPTPYPPFSEVVITSHQGESTTFILASDEVDTIIKTGLSNHHLLLCEETKKLERIICPGKTFVQPLVRYYAEITDKAEALSTNFGDTIDPNYSWSKERNDPNVSLTIRSIIMINQLYHSSNITIPALTDMHGATNYIYEESRYGQGYFGASIERIEILDSKLTVIKSFENAETHVPQTVTLESGQYYTIKYALGGTSTNLTDPNLMYRNVGVNVEFQFSVTDEAPDQKPPLYITDVTNQLLEIAEPIRMDEDPRYMLDADTAAKYAKTPCNELNFANGATLRENLDEIAGLVHCITRLKDGKIYFDPVGDPVLADSTSLGDPVSVRSSANLEKYATHLDSFVDNLMNAQDPKQGAISDPFIGVYRTPRALISNTDARVTVSNCRIDTTFGIEKIEKVEVLYNGNAYDITAFVYEKSEYDLLETNSGVYPYAKAYAIYYTQGQKGLDGLQHRVEDAVTNAFKNPAIANILSVVTGRNIDWFSNSDFFGTAILDYAFNVTYISAVRGRVRAAKTDISDIVATSAIAFNQSAPRLSSVNYGERLKGETAMLSEPEVHLVFKTNDLPAVMDSVGKLYIWNNDRYYISKVTYKVWRGYIIAEMTLSRNFNQLGRFVSINNSFRQFEIDDNSQEECIVYEDYAVFSTTYPTNYTNTSLQSSYNIIKSIWTKFKDVSNTNSNVEVTLAKAETFDADSNLIASFYLPVQSLALGNSLLFNFAFKDNYSAGDFLQPQGGYKLTRAAPYGDPLYGEAKGLKFSLNSTVSFANTSVTDVGDSLPLAKYTPTLGTVAETPVPIIVNKSSRDILNLTYQVHFVTDSHLIFGSALLQKNRLVSSLNNREAYLVILPFEINPLSPPVPTFDQFAGSPGVTQSIIKFGEITANAYQLSAPADPAESDGVLTILPTSGVPTGGKSWAIFSRMGAYADNDQLPDGSPNQVDTEFLIGGNGSPKPIYVYLKHNII